MGEAGVGYELKGTDMNLSLAAGMVIENNLCYLLWKTHAVYLINHPRVSY